MLESVCEACTWPASSHWLIHMQRGQLSSAVKTKCCLLWPAPSSHHLGNSPDMKHAWMHRYLAYEKNLEELRAFRKAKSASQQIDAGLEAAIPRRVHFIYERATRRFKGHLRYWHAWLDWCQATDGSKRFSRVRGGALSWATHPPWLVQGHSRASFAPCAWHTPRQCDSSGAVCLNHCQAQPAKAPNDASG